MTTIGWKGFILLTTVVLALTIVSTASADSRSYLPCAPKGTNGLQRMTLHYRPAKCLISDRDISGAGYSDLRNIEWRGWGKPEATARASFRGERIGDPPIAATLTVDQTEYCGRYFYSRIKITTRYGSSSMFIAPACEYTDHQRKFADAVEAHIGGPTVVTVRPNNCRVGPTSWKWRCYGTANWSENNGAPDDYTECVADYTAHFKSGRVILDDHPGCTEVGRSLPST